MMKKREEVNTEVQGVENGNRHGDGCGNQS